MDDLISREAALDALRGAEAITRAFGYHNVIDTILELPSAQPEPHWIPCSERMPKEKQDVLLAFRHNMVVGFWEDILNDGGVTWYANSGDGWFTGTEDVDSDGIPTAWMPLPEPYKGG